ncbi:hypothetical protein QUF70_12605 [Desulfobacterales bacterium HSG17]|nr:hypothetical protein [Desulfobacterales bacterium HSG17]
MATSKDRRAEPRNDIITPIELFPFNQSGLRQDATVMNASESGLYLKTSTNFPISKYVSIQKKISPGEESQDSELQTLVRSESLAKVCWCEALSEDEQSDDLVVGVEYFNPSY